MAPRDITAACAICKRTPGEEDCPCETKALRKAIETAEKKWLDSWMSRVHDWVTGAAVRYITTSFEALKQRRMQAYKTYVYSLPYYREYRQWHGRPPIHPTALHELKSSLVNADRVLQQGVNADWSACVLKYPEVLDHFYNQIVVSLPPAMEPPFGGHGGPRPGGPGPAFPPSPTTKRRAKRSSMGVPADTLGFEALDLGQAPRRRRDSMGGSYVVSGPGRAPAAPEPPIASAYPLHFGF